MLKSAVHRRLRPFGIRAVKARTPDAANARTRELQELAAALRAEADSHRAEADARQKQLGHARADLRDRDAELTRLREQVADTTRQLNRERDARLAALEQLEQVRAVTQPAPAAQPTAD